MNWSEVIAKAYKKVEIRDHTISYDEMMYCVSLSLFKKTTNIFLSMDFPEGIITPDQMNKYIYNVWANSNTTYEFFPSSRIEDALGVGFLYRSWEAEPEMRRYELLEQNRVIQGREAKEIINTEQIFFYPSRKVVDAVYENKVEVNVILDKDELRRLGYKLCNPSRQ